MTETQAEDLAGPLLAWFDAHRRDLPWRHTRDPYRIWVSEVMLQQTQVDRVIAYYERFIAAFPTVEALANAPVDDVLRLWEGLGYYSRARNLHATAQAIVSQHGGRFPASATEARALPGVGGYTAGAVLSIAFGIALPAVDANAARVLARLFAIEGDLARGEGRRRIADLARRCVPEERPGDFNQALMELGALICIPGRPGCLICPLTALCMARAAGVQERIPPAKSEPSRRVSVVAGIVSDRGRVLVAKRPVDGQWGGLWEFPNTRIRSDAPPSDLLSAYLSETFGLRVRAGEEFAALSYGVMNRRVALTALECALLGGALRPADHVETRWARAGDLRALPMPSPHRTLAQFILQRRG